MLKDKVICVIGATGGMGKVLCENLAREGAKLILSSQREEALQELKQTLCDSFGVKVFAQQVDCTREEQVEAFFQEAGQQFGTMDALVNLAGLSIPGQITETEEAIFNQMMDVNVRTIYLASKHYVKYAAPGARIINIGSMAARRTNGNAPLYCMAKSAVNVISEGLQLQLASRDIRVTALNPGGADTPFWGDRKVKRKNMLQPQDVVDTILFVLNSNHRVAIHSIDFESIHMIG